MFENPPPSGGGVDGPCGGTTQSSDSTPCAAPGAFRICKRAFLSRSPMDLSKISPLDWSGRYGCMSGSRRAYVSAGPSCLAQLVKKPAAASLTGASECRRSSEMRVASLKSRRLCC